MLEQAIYENYGIQMERQEPVGGYHAFISRDTLFSIIPLQEINEADLKERLGMSEHLKMQGDKYVSSFVMSKNQTYISEADGTIFLLLSNPLLKEPRDLHLGRKLARFHIRGRSYPSQVKECSRIGQWKGMWEQRIDQLETVWREKLQSHPNNEVERIFVESFPYYMALGENAIQYLVDTEIDEQPGEPDAGTVSHERFSKQTWAGKYLVRNPFQWVFDHRSRDISEWIRQHYLLNPHTYQPQMKDFVSHYQRTSPLTAFSARLLYSRLLFPIHYYETIENYFIAGAESKQNELQESLETMINRSHLYEAFLQSFYEASEIPARALKLPKLDWL
ncbi:spore coat putative kinase YutH [Peribacillus kribbensis]|uniref:spore coat putative kinase YutH n=1 Tax=Peribacillus kribbensis TaxID=356658 RepID=UPI000400E0E7|nr:spore coat protein YutH [Peribacillus kribbensis]